MSNLVPLESITFECTVEGGVPMKSVKHDVYTFVRGERVVSDGKGCVISRSREMELMKLLGSKEVYATGGDIELYYSGR